MIQELLGGSNVGILDRNKFDPPPSQNAPSPSSSPATAAAAPENLRCPRCDSSNTKFCYYNNYNLTQPRHFCKTCRRYWTKGGALRNVPIGGGCRKNKSAAVGKPTPAGPPRAKTTSSDQTVRTGVFAEALSSNPIIWASSQNSHFLSLLRPSPNHPKDESAASLFATPHMSSDSLTHSMHARALGFDHPGPAPFYRNQTPQGIMYGDQNLQEAYQRLRSSGNCYPDHAPFILGNLPSSAILDSSPVTPGEMGFWNPTQLSWPTDSAYP